MRAWAWNSHPWCVCSNGRLHPSTADLRDLAARNRGLTWLIGNEPDVKWQDNTAPEVYAIAYHRAYEAIKAGDPTAQVAIGGISEVTPLRLEYLDRVWDFYRSLYGEDMPVDVWNMHAFMLPEQRGGWGVNMPPGFDDRAARRTVGRRRPRQPHPAGTAGPRHAPVDGRPRPA